MRKNRKQESVHFHPGVYKFDVPYLSGHLVRDENGEVKVYHAKVEMHVGDQRDLDNGKLATVIVVADKNNGIGITNFYEDIAASIRSISFDHIFYTHLKDNGFKEEHVRFIEVYPKGYMDREWSDIKEVSLTWDERNRWYKDIKWNLLKDNDWAKEYIENSDFYLKGKRSDN